MNEIGPLFSQVIPSHSAKSHDFFDAHGGIYWINVFPLKLMCISFYLIKILSYSNVRIRFLNAHFCFLSVFYYAIFQNVHTNRWMEMQLLIIDY